MQTKNFKGQDLRGRSFKGQDLTGADFSDCDLRGVDFSFANLTDARFCNARMGRTKKERFFMILLQMLFGAITGFIASFIFQILFLLADESLRLFKLNNGLNTLIFSIIYTILLFFVILTSINRKKPITLHIFLYLAIALSGLIAIKAKVLPLMVLFAILMIYGVVFIGVIFTIMMAMITSEKKYGNAHFIFSGIIGSYFLYTMLDKLALTNNTAFTNKIANIGSVIICFVIICMLFGIYLGKRAINKEEQTLLSLRHLSLEFNCLFGTKFTFSNLQNVDFVGTDLLYSSFKNSYIYNCYLLLTENHYLALTKNTPLESRKVCELVIDGIITDKNFSNLDLRGLNFYNRNLQGFDFSHANLSGANLSHTQMTGAILEGWAIDTETRLDDIECSYYYYLDNGEKKRMPPEGEEYKAGEFTRIFQKIANTIDFIAHNEMELAAIKLSVEQVRVESGNDDIRVQTIEEKNGVIVVKVAVPKFEDRGILYHELKQKNTQIQLRLRDKSHRIKELRSEIDILKNQINEKRQTLTIIVKDSTINNDGGVVNFGEINGNISQQNTL